MYREIKKNLLVPEDLLSAANIAYGPNYDNATIKYDSCANTYGYTIYNTWAPRNDNLGKYSGYSVSELDLVPALKAYGFELTERGDKAKVCIPIYDTHKIKLLRDKLEGDNGVKEFIIHFELYENRETRFIEVIATLSSNAIIAKAKLSIDKPGELYCYGKKNKKKLMVIVDDEVFLKPKKHK